MSISTELIRLRKKAGLTQHELADLSGISRALISNIERGERTPPLDKMDSLITALKLDGEAARDFREKANLAHSPTEMLDVLRDQRAQLKIFNEILGIGVDVEVTERDLKLCKGDLPAAKILAIRRRAHQFCADRIDEAEGRKKRPRMTSSPED